MPIGNYDGDMDALVENGIYRVGENENLPTQVYYSQAIVCRGKNSDTVVQIVIDYDSATMMFRGASNASGQWDWVDWQQVAIAAPPQEFDLPLADGWSGWAKYSKDQFGRVLVYGLVAKSTALISGDVIGTFPEGFRPSATCPMTITSGNASDGKSFATSGYVQPSGALTLSNGTISSVYKLGNNLAFNFVFPAAD